MRFTSLTLVSVAILLAVGLFSYFQLGFYTAEDLKEYESLVKSTDPQETDENAQPYTSTQQHRTTHKDIWFSQGDQRLQLRLRSEDTRLVLEHHDRNIQVVEHMQGVTCFIQEKLYYLTKEDGQRIPMQIVRYLEADNASYYYQADRFLAEQVHVMRVAMPGHTLTESLEGLTPFMTGVARSVEFGLSGTELNFTAYQLKATLYQSEEIL